MSKIITVTNLGLGNKGQISAADLTLKERNRIIQDVSKSTYARKATKRFRCVDGRTPEDGLSMPPDMADPQEAGGAAISETAADLMGSHPIRLSELVVKNTRQNIDAGYEVVVHGDNKHGKAGCGANKNLRAILRSNAENIDVVVPMAWTLCQALGLESLMTKDELKELILIGKQNADNDALWDVPPEQIVDIAIETGATYEELIEDHMERVVVVSVSEVAFDEEHFMKDHMRPDGKPIEVFVASLGAVKAKLFDIAQKTGQTEATAARKTMGVVLFNIGVPKELTAEVSEANPNAALPVVVLG